MHIIGAKMMGFFSKIKQNLAHGGVSVHVQGPASVSMQQPAFPVSIVVTAKDTPVTINKVTVEIIRENRNQSFNGGTSQQSAGPTIVTVARVDNTETFTLAAGESRTVQLSLVMNAGAAIAQNLPEGSGMAQFAGALQKLESVADALNQDSYSYYLEGKADVDGIALDPADKQPLQVLKPGQIGGAVNIGL